RYLAMARLVRAARHFENPGRSITDVANHLEYSSAQSFSRHVQLLLDCTPMTFRKQFTGERMLDVFRETLVLPYRDLLRTFEPFAVTPQWSVLRDRQVDTACQEADLEETELPEVALT
ncbi:MAG: helix-turn-helix domain-containing protein, partial [Gemmatimonadaceae bacterium]